MDIEIKEAQEIIKNLGSGGELSIKEEKYLNVAKLCVQLAAERDSATLEYDYLNDQIEYWKNKSINITEQRNKLDADLTPLEHENVHYADAAGMEIAALRQRIAELESRTVKLPTTRLWAGVTECYEKSDVIAAIRAAGVEVSDD
ncbi:hypothetical protein vBKpnSMK54_57 [Klebsiella phage vB_KpnS_MK54]|uniref:hypothetical protein n=1 Tax=Klebsiella phage vB_KpnS_MK54 TaxID=2783667 RepID=UPI001CE68FC3|nr:hypothetical protein PRB83_gp57 [Klebsiella phage vB_KpnS_MK54]QZD26099.1 hypothetical protein vBKpnSMK54_57 [Klebsiella phage vB_KpnS_MK54]